MNDQLRHDAPSDDVRIRTATPDEAETVLAFWAEAAEGTSITDDVDGVTRLIRRDPDALILAEADGLLVGSVIAGWDGWRCSLYRLAVLPPYRRRGIATVLLAAAEARFAAVGGRRGDAMVLEANDRAQRAWASAGYRREERWRRWVKPYAEPAAGH
ncbi:GNAT family N-acetyltransferase [Streptomyces clavuligerus]|uniref:Acetyltransferase n=1 Tax=Streptomyces clavuligerus TaxID=1901 RepID=E2Q9J1_STRCL|nr:GNAT family N-acetyltransferase [Streptomyces clavuligerus]ANW21271.1 GCN5 family acetyltransferase [Streptomyces clavuligerus]AXU15897.1 GNAT family N-acetyltransferase [Streptomyces clavuligerus]EFG05611.1 Acetyltransferase [Streptomyces clavuligerus]MBY6306023.1 GNAT family N-acetyltransferase [Streptomyces clavuligerus]QCS08678.1 N-acetyltransferase [Streptomyces clavuligerus]